MSTDTYRATNGNARASYHPEWCANYPWVTYINGSAGRHFVTARQALSYLEAKGYSFITPKE